MGRGMKAVFNDEYLRVSKTLFAMYINGLSQHSCRWSGKNDDLQSP